LPKGGLSGGPGQLPHLASTYAGINALICCGITEAYQSIDRQAFYQFFMSLRLPDGSFRMHDMGERDVRGVYCVLSVASLLNILTVELVEGTADWVASCQTYEGGFAGEPGNEAHGGYSFCALASLVILNATHKIDKKTFLRWLIQRQLPIEGGFQGRSNKLVDGCYSFWQGGVFPLVDRIIITPQAYNTNQGTSFTECIFEKDKGGWCFDQSFLQQYILGCCQSPAGGLIDKPGKSSDFLSYLLLFEWFIHRST